jgi:hypothetical protein
MDKIYHISLANIVGKIDADKHTVNDFNFIKEFGKIEEKSYKNNVKDIICFDLLKGLEVITLNTSRCYLWRRMKGQYGKTNLKYSDFHFEFRISEYNNFIDTEHKTLKQEGVFASWHNGIIKKHEEVTKFIMESLDKNDQILENDF